MSHLVTRPLTQVRSAMEEVGEGDYSARLPVDKSSDEMTVLSSGFNEMAAQLEKAAGHLEELVAERTLALEHAYGELERHF